MKTYAVIGLGRFGTEIAKELTAQGKEVLAIDVNENLVDQVADDVTNAVVADCQDLNVLKSLGIEDFDCAIVSIGENLGTSAMCVINLKELNVPYIICKVYNEKHKKIMEKLGVDRVILPEKEYANRLAKSLSSKSALDYIELSDTHSIIEIPVPKSWYGKTLSNLSVRTKFDVNVLAVKRNGKLEISPSANYTFGSDSTILILGTDKALKSVQMIQ